MSPHHCIRELYECIMIQQYFTVTAPVKVFSQYLKQIKYQMLIFLHPQSEENMKIRWGF